MSILKLRLLFALFIVFISLGIRFYRFSDQWDVFGDAGRDQIVGWGAVSLHQLPMVGSFSSSGAFVFGPLYYWFIAACYKIFPAIPASPQLFFRLLLLLPIIFLWKAGQIAGGRRLAVILALLIATSPATVERTTSMTHHALVTVTSTLFMWLFFLYIRSQAQITTRKRRLLLAFAMGMAFGLGFNIHFQALNLWPVFVVYLILNRFAIWRIWPEIVAIVVGFVLPNLAYFWWDATVNGWANLRNFLDYLLIAGERRYVPNRWLSYLFKFWPELWSSVIGGFSIFGYALPLLVAATWLWQVWKKNLNRYIFWLGIIFIINIVVLRYYRGEVFLGYFLIFHPFILIFSAWAIALWYSISRIGTLIFLAAIVIVNLWMGWQILEQDVNRGQVDQAQATVKKLSSLFPNRTFTPYIYGDSPEDRTYGMIIMLAHEGLLSENGKPIGVCKLDCPPEYLLLLTQDYREQLAFVDLEGLDLEAINRANASRIPPWPPWQKLTIQTVYDDVALWWEKKPLTSSFSLKKYLLGTLGFHQ
ncbi:glycosyltransferase family 39 protein [Candidatus Woesebacteria bacterium]|nr:glycosyltransferase family 39 protein [Candidatus Woesebacteria bacterium]